MEGAVSRVQIRAVRLPVLLIEVFLQNGCDYRVRTCCISMLKLRQRIGHCAGLTGVITGTRIVGRMLRNGRIHCWRISGDLSGAARAGPSQIEIDPVVEIQVKTL